jgi:hypothetical protein
MSTRTVQPAKASRKSKPTVRQSVNARKHLPRQPRNQRKDLRRAIRERRPLFKRLLMHPLTMFTVLCTGVLLYGLTSITLADQDISSTIEAPRLQAPAIITSPADTTTLETQLVNVVGTCPPNSYIRLQDNGAFSGVAWCDSTNGFSIATSLYPATNTLTIQDYNITDLAGPSSPGITVNYNVPTEPDSASPSTTTTLQTNNSGTTRTQAVTAMPKQDVPPIVLTSNFKFTTFNADKSFSWKIDLEGGVPPYSVHVDWGDSTNSNLVFKTDPVFTIAHQYKHAGYYPINVRSTDTKRQVQVIQLAALINTATGNEPYITPLHANTNQPQSSPSTGAANTLRHVLPFAWTPYLILVLMTVSFWLGEAREYRQTTRLANK